MRKRSKYFCNNSIAVLCGPKVHGTPLVNGVFSAKGWY